MSSGPTPVFEEPVSGEQALAGMLSAFLSCVGFSFEGLDDEGRRDLWASILDRAGVDGTGSYGPIERHLFKAD